MGDDAPCQEGGSGWGEGGGTYFDQRAMLLHASDVGEGDSYEHQKGKEHPRRYDFDGDVADHAYSYILQLVLARSSIFPAGI